MRKLALLEKVSLIQRLRRTNGSALGIWVRKALMKGAEHPRLLQSTNTPRTVSALVEIGRGITCRAE